MSEEYAPEVKNKLWQAFQDWDESRLLLDTEVDDFMFALECRGLKLVEIKKEDTWQK